MNDEWTPYGNVQYPHCDSRILHAPGECKYCDNHPEWQADRVVKHIAFTGHSPLEGQVPCPADVARPPGSESDHRRWAGNKPTNPVDGTWPEETFASRVLYGELESRVTPEEYHRHLIEDRGFVEATPGIAYWSIKGICLRFLYWLGVR